MRKKNISARRLLRMRVTFSKSPMVSGAVSKLGCTELIFVEPAAKINGEYYRDILLQKLLPAIRRVSGDIFVFEHQDSAPVHRARDTIELLHVHVRRSTPDFIALDMWPPNSPDLTSTRLTMSSGQSYSSVCIRPESTTFN